MVEYDNVIVGIIEILLVMCIPFISIILLMYWQIFDIRLMIIVLYIISIAAFAFSIYLNRHFFISESKRGRSLIIFGQKKEKSIFIYLGFLIISSILFIQKVDILDVKIFSWQFILWFCIASTSVLLIFLDKSRSGIYQNGIEKKRFIPWKKIINYKIENNKIYIKVKNRNLGIRNDFLMYIGEVDNKEKEEIISILNENI